MKKLIAEQAIAPVNSRLEIKYKVLTDGSRSYYGAWRSNNKERKYLGHVTGNKIPLTSAINYKKRKKKKKI